jgi:hypothetical protein
MMFGLNPEDIPPEVRAQLDRQHAQRQTLRTELRYFMKELDPHKLWLLRMLFSSIAHDDDAPDKQAAYWEGVITGYLEQGGICPGCGRDHIAEEFPGTASPVSEESKPDSPKTPIVLDRQALLDEYEVTPELDPDTGRVVCRNCKTVYLNLEDRMVKKDCHGCQRKDAWG